MSTELQNSARNFRANKENIALSKEWTYKTNYDAKTKIYKGITPDIFALLSQKCGIQFVYEGGTSGDVLTSIKNDDRRNALTSISYDYVWAEQHNVQITQPFVSSAIVKFGRNLDADKPIVAVNEKAYFTFALAKELSGVTKIHFPKQIQRIEAVYKRDADYTFVTEDQAKYYFSIPKYSSLKTSRMAGYNQDICICVGKESDPELMTIISKGLASITHDESTTILRNNTVDAYEWTIFDFMYAYRIPLTIIIVLLIVIVISLVFVFAIKRRSAEKLEAAYEQEKAAFGSS